MTDKVAVPMTARNATLDDLATLLKDQHARKLDVVASATSIHAEDGRLVIAGAEPVIDTDGVTPADGIYTPTEICDAGIADKLGIPVGYLRRTREQRPDLYDVNVNAWLHGYYPTGQGRHCNEIPDLANEVPADPRSFLVRCFRGDDGPGIARAFLSDRYCIVDNLDVLTAALDGVQRAGVQVVIDGCDLTESHMRVRVVAPQIAAYAPDLLKDYRSPFDGSAGAVRAGGWTPERVRAAARAEGQAYEPGTEPVVWSGFEFSNSETGGGAFTLTPRLVVQVCRNGLTVTADALRAVHLGGRMDDGIIRWSQDTQRRSLDLVTAKTRDAVATFLNVDYVRRQVATIEAKAGAAVVDAPKTIETLGKRLSYSEAEQTSILNFFTRSGQLTAGGILQAVTALAQTVENPDRAHELEASALRALELAAVAR